MADIARAAKVHHTTVSLALRNNARLPIETRARIRAIAERMGYRPDPMLSALNFYRSSKYSVKNPPSMGFIMRSRVDRPLDSFYADDQFLSGARRACAQIGYQLVEFHLVGTPGEGARLSRILRSRGIGGIILASLDTAIHELNMAWDQFSALCIETQHLGLSLHTVGNNQMSGTRTAVRRLSAMGYRRIGLAVGAVEEEALKNPFSAGYLIEVHRSADLIRVPPLLLRSYQHAENLRNLRSWIERHQIEAVLSNWNAAPEMLRSIGLRIPEDIGFATLDQKPDEGAVAGIRQSHEPVGECAVEALALLMKTNQKGQTPIPRTTLVDGHWQDGPELPVKQSASKHA